MFSGRCTDNRLTHRQTTQPQPPQTFSYTQHISHSFLNLLLSCPTLIYPQVSPFSLSLSMLSPHASSHLIFFYFLSELSRLSISFFLLHFILHFQAFSLILSIFSLSPRSLLSSSLTHPLILFFRLSLSYFSMSYFISLTSHFSFCSVCHSYLFHSLFYSVGSFLYSLHKHHTHFLSLHNST